jgi:hypothetical protein
MRLVASGGRAVTVPDVRATVATHSTRENTMNENETAAPSTVTVWVLAGYYRDSEQPGHPESWVYARCAHGLPVSGWINQGAYREVISTQEVPAHDTRVEYAMAPCAPCAAGGVEPTTNL